MRVLLVHEDESARAAIAAQLRSGVDVTITDAADVEPVLERADRSLFAEHQAIVLFAAMDQTRVLRSLCALRAQQKESATPVLVVSTTKLHPSDTELARLAGADDLLQWDGRLTPVLQWLERLFPRPASDSPVTTFDGSTLDEETLPTRFLRVGRSQLDARHQLIKERDLSARLRKRTSSMQDQLAVLTALSEALLNQRLNQTVLYETLSICFAGLPRTAGALYLYEPDGSLTARPLGATSQWPSQETERLFGSATVLQQILAAGEAAWVGPQDELDEATRTVLRRSGGEWALIVPLAQMERSLGALLLTAPAEDDAEWTTFGRTAANQITHALLLAGALTEREQAEAEALAQKRVRSDQAALLRLVLDSMSEGVMVADERGGLLLWNAVAASLVPGVTEDPGLDGRAHALGLFHSDGITPFLSAELPLARATRGEFVDDVEIFVRPVGAPAAEGRYLVSTARPLVSGDGELRGGVVVFHDVSEQRRAQHEILKSRADWRALVESAPDIVIKLDREGIIRFINRVVPGFSVEEVIGRPWVEFLSTEHRAVAKVDFDRVIATGESSNQEVLGQGPEGAEAWYSSNLGPIFDGDRIVGVVIVSHDITRRKKAELQLMVSDRMTSIGTLAAGVAHEINNPLAAMLANIDVLTHQLTEVVRHTELSPDIFSELGDARIAGERVRQIVRDLTNLSRSDEANQHSAVDVHRVLESSVRMAWTEIRHRARLTRQLGPIPRVAANEARLGQVLLNLLVNAAQAIEPGFADENEIRISTSVDPTNGRVVVSVSDSGSGILPEVRSRLFTPFVTTKPAGVGTGLGLSICHRLLTAMGGTIDFDSERDQGTTFRITLTPVEIAVAASEIEEARPVSAAKPLAPRRGRVLVVDDEPILAQAVTRVLQREHAVTTMNSATAALEAIRGGERYDVVLCDLMMPQVTGMDFYEALKQEVPELAARVVFLTGGAFTPRASEFLETVGLPHIEKPFDVDALRAEVNRRVAAT